MLPRVPARSPPRGSAAEPRGRAGVTDLEGRPAASARPEAELERFTEPAERLVPVDLLMPAEERFTSVEGRAVERWVLVERETLPELVERRFCVLVEGRDAVLPEREALPVERLTLPEEREALEEPEERRFWALTEGREAALLERDTLEDGREALAVERDAPAEGRDTLAEEREALEDGRETLAEEREAPAEERDTLPEEREAPAEERETLEDERLAPPPPRDWA